MSTSRQLSGSMDLGGRRSTIHAHTQEDAEYVPSPDLPGDEFIEVRCDEKKLGFKFSGVEIVEVSPGTWADEAGVELDDEVGRRRG